MERDNLLLRGCKSLPEELCENYETWVCEPIIKYPLSPRWAKLILTIVGEMLLKGMPVSEIVLLLESKKKL